LTIGMRAPMKSKADSLVCAFATAKQKFSPEERPWLTAFIDWARQLQPTAFRHSSAEIDNAYRAHLATEGLTGAEIERRWSSIYNQRAASEEWLGLTNDNLYADGWYQGLPPSNYLSAFLQGMVPGSALDCGMGAGRNALLLASSGWKVTGIDLSEVALRRARQLATNSGTQIETIGTSYSNFPYVENRWDLIINIDAYHWTFANAPLRESLKPRGFVFIEQHLSAHSRPDPLLLERLSSLEVVRYELTLDPMSKGPSQDVMILIAQKPGCQQYTGR
jgi:SAM-dependent methyltransferase